MNLRKLVDATYDLGSMPESLRKITLGAILGVRCAWSEIDEEIECLVFPCCVESTHDVGRN